MGPLALLFGALGPVLERLFPDPIERQKVQMQMEAQAQAADLAQIEVNKVEAASSSMFVAGWRPFIGWVCGVSMGWELVGRSWAVSIASLIGERAYNAVTSMPQPNTELMWAMLCALLGLGSMRSYEKIKGVAK